MLAAGPERGGAVPVTGILVIGGYGGFGGRLARRLAAVGHHVLVGGRDLKQATRFCENIPGTEPAVVDRDGDVAAALARLEPDLVIDAAGPFQHSHFEVPLACIAANVPYLDLADAREFVTGISALNVIAGEVRVPIVSGASSAPGLTGAVVRKLAEGMERVTSVDIALSAANRATGGHSVVAAILSYIGQRVPIWRAGRWSHAYGWQEMRREDFVFADGTGLRGRLVALADLPDCELLPSLLPGRPAVAFRAGTEFGFQMRALWLASWAVRWGWVKSLGNSARWLLPLYRLTCRWGGERSAMNVTLAGTVGGRRLERCWTIVAEQGEGVEVPTLTAELLAGDILAGRLPAGARNAASLMSLDRYGPLLSELAVRHEIRERTLPSPLYERVMGAPFQRLPSAVRTMHELCDGGAAGQGKVERGRNLAARLVGALMRFPPEGTWPLHVTFAEHEGRERWTRDFAGHRFSSELSRHGNLLVERFGPIRFFFALHAREGSLDMVLRRWTLFGLPMPLALAPKIRAEEREQGGRFRFDVEASLPGIGRIVRYSGWLRPLEQLPTSGEAAPAATVPA
jgi:hypothetical protein